MISAYVVKTTNIQMVLIVNLNIQKNADGNDTVTFISLYNLKSS